MARRLLIITDYENVRVIIYQTINEIYFGITDKNLAPLFWLIPIYSQMKMSFYPDKIINALFLYIRRNRRTP